MPRVGLLLLLTLPAAVVTAAAAADKYSLAGVHLTIVTVEDPPFIQVRDNPLGPIKPWNEWGGWVVEIIKLLSAESGFTYTLQLPTGSNTFAYGAADKDISGEWLLVLSWPDPRFLIRMLRSG